MHVVLGVLAAVIKAVVGQQYVAVEIDAAAQGHVVKDIDRCLRASRVGKLIEDAGIELGVYAGVSGYDLMLPTLQLLDFAHFAPDAELVYQAILEAAAQVCLAGADIGDQLTGLSHHRHAVDIDTEAVVVRITHQGQVIPNPRLHECHQLPFSADGLLAAHILQDRAAVVHLA